MEIITNSEKLSDKKFLRSLRHGVYVMQNSRNPYEFCIGAVGTTGDSVLRRLQQHIRFALGWRLVFFTQFPTADKVYSAESVLIGVLCNEYYRRTNTKFSVDKNACSFHYVAERVQHTANEAIDHFATYYGYSLEGLGFRPVDLKMAA
jgi:hypothetical protein